MRIVSLLPSATEIVCELGLGDQLVGVTHECDYPPFVRDLPKVTHTSISSHATSREIDAQVREQLATQRALYTLNMPLLEQLSPDLIVTQKLCEVCAVSESEVAAAACSLPGHPRVVNLEPTRLAEVLESIRTVAEAAGVPHRADEVLARLQSRIGGAIRVRDSSNRPSVVMLEWIDPPFCAGHWTPELVRMAGGRELIGREFQPSRRITWPEIVAADPEVLCIACCGLSADRARQDLPVLTSHPCFQDLKCVRDRQVYVFDGNAYFNRPGPRLVDSLEILSRTLQGIGKKEWHM